MIKVAILGSTGSIGTQALDVIAANPEIFKVQVLTAHANHRLLRQQIERFRPEFAVLTDAQAAKEMTQQDLPPEVKFAQGIAALESAASFDGTDVVLNALVGFAGLAPSIACINAGKTLAIANKETLVAAGALVMELAKKKRVAVVPVDSEHSAIAQCLAGEQPSAISRLLLTASGGPLRGCKADEFAGVTLQRCLKHPNWEMGRKITIDSATLMNKGLEVIEASWLFACPVSRIEVVVHPQSIIHSMVELRDGSVLGQMGFPDMTLPIQLALTWPERLPGRQPVYNPFDPRTRQLTFEEPDRQTFRLLQLAYDAAAAGGTLPAVMNTANEAAVELFLAGRIGFLDIARRVETCMEHHLRQGCLTDFDFDDIMELDAWARSDVAAQA